MIAKVNFIEREVFALTYRKTAMLAGGVLTFLILITLVQFFQGKLLQARVNRLVQEVRQLKAEKERVLQVFEKEKSAGASSQQGIWKSLMESPRWSGVLRKLSRTMPSDLWLVSFKSYQDTGGSKKWNLIFSGEATEAREVSLFLSELEKSELFLQPVLSDSKQEERGASKIYLFTINAQLSEWALGGDGG